MVDTAWREAARADIETLSPIWVHRYGWAPRVVDDDEHIDIYLNFRSRERLYRLRIRYEADFREVGRREEFCDPDDPNRCGAEYWPPEGGAYKRSHEAICIPGTFGYHRKLHANDNKYPVETTTLGQLIHRIQRTLEAVT